MFTSLFTPKPKQSKAVTFDDMVAPWLLQQERWRQEDEQKTSSATSPLDSAHPQQGRKAFRKIGVVAIKRIAMRVLRRTQKTDAPTSTMAATSGAAVPTPVPTLVPTLVSSPPVTCTSSEDVLTSSTTGPTTLSHPGYMASSPAADNGLMQFAQDTSAHECTVPSPTASSHPSILEPATPVTDTHLYDGSKSGISVFVLESSAVKIEPALHETADGVFDCHNPEDEGRPGSPALSAHEVPNATLQSIATSDSADDDLSSAICPAPSPIAPTVAHSASSVTTSAAVEAHPVSIANSISAHPSSTKTADIAVEAHPASIATDGHLVTAQSASGMGSDLAGSVLRDATDGSAAEASLASSASPVGSSVVGEVHGPSVDGDTSVNATVDSDAQEISFVAPEVWTSCYMRDEGTASLSDLTGSEDTVLDNRRCWEAEEFTGKSDTSSSSHSPSSSFLYIPGLGSSTCDATADDADIPVAALSTDREDLAFGSLRLDDGGSESGAQSIESEAWYGVEASQVVGSRGHIESGCPTAARTGERAQVVPRGPQGLPARHSPTQPNWAVAQPMPLHTSPHRPPSRPQPRFTPEDFNPVAVNPAPVHPPLPPRLDQRGFTDARFNTPIINRGPLHPPHPPMPLPQQRFMPRGFNAAAIYHPPVHAPHHETPLAGPSRGWYVPERDGPVPHELYAGNGPRAAAGPLPPSPRRPYNPQQQNNGAQPYRNQRPNRHTRDPNRPFDFIECAPTM